MMGRPLLRWWSLALAVCAATACRSQKAPEGPQRIVSLSPSITETLFAIGAGDAVVGVTDYCDYPAEVNKRKRTGSILQPNFEEIARLRPTLIVGEEVKNSPEDKLKVLADTHVVPWLSIQEVVKGTRELGRLTHHEQAAEEIVKQYEAKIQPRVAPTSPRVLAVIGAAPGPFSEIWFTRKNSLHGAMLEAAGARNAIDENITGSPVLSLERVVAIDPDAIVVLVSMEGVTEETRQKYIDSWKVLPTLKAVKNDRVYVLVGTDVQSTGPRILSALDRLSTLVRSIGATP